MSSQFLSYIKGNKEQRTTSVLTITTEKFNEKEDEMKRVNKYKIEKNIQVPEPRNNDLVQAVEAMEVGESFEFEADKRQHCYSAAKYRDYEIAIRKIDEDTCRIWRTA
jgi:hypothetical protein